MVSMVLLLRMSLTCLERSPPNLHFLPHGMPALAAFTQFSKDFSNSTNQEDPAWQD